MKLVQAFSRHGRERAWLKSSQWWIEVSLSLSQNPSYFLLPSIIYLCFHLLRHLQMKVETFSKVRGRVFQYSRRLELAESWEKVCHCYLSAHFMHSLTLCNTIAIWYSNIASCVNWSMKYVTAVSASVIGPGCSLTGSQARWRLHCVARQEDTQTHNNLPRPTRAA